MLSIDHSASVEFKAAITAAYSRLRRSMLKLTRRMDVAEDIAQETMRRALSNHHQFQEGTNLDAWLYAIGRNTYVSMRRKLKWEQDDPDGVLANNQMALDDPHAALELSQTLERIDRLPTNMRKVVRLICLMGLSYEEVAEITCAEVGTVKSRLNRARNLLQQPYGAENDKPLKNLTRTPEQHRQELEAIRTRNPGLNEVKGGYVRIETPIQSNRVGRPLKYDRDQIIRMLEEGKTPHQIEVFMEMSKNRIYSILRKMKISLPYVGQSKSVLVSMNPSEALVRTPVSKRNEFEEWLNLRLIRLDEIIHRLKSERKEIEKALEMIQRPMEKVG